MTNMLHPFLLVAFYDLGMDNYLNNFIFIQQQQLLFYFLSYSTVTLLARFLGLSTSQPRCKAA